MLWNKLLLIAIISFSGRAFSEGKLVYLLNNFDDSIHVSAININNSTIIFPFNFCLSSIGDLKFVITDLEDRNYQIKAQLNDRCTVRNEQFIEPFSSVGKVFHKDEIQFYYKLPDSDFNIKAVFCNFKKQCVESNSLRITYRSAEKKGKNSE